MTPEEIIAKANSFGGWYHRIELTPGFWTGLYRADIAPQWEMVRQVRAPIDYVGKRVLDVGTMDGMWAFEAEQAGALEVTAIDIWQGDYLNAKGRFELAREALNSNVNFVHDSVEDMRLVSGGGNFQWDIIQFPGVLYHLENPILALRNLRSVAAPGAVMLLETAVWPDRGAPMARFNSDRGIYDDPTTFWAMNPACLYASLRLAGWEPHQTGGRAMPAGPTERHCFLCDAK